LNSAELKKIPGVDTLLEKVHSPDHFPEPLVKSVIRSVLSRTRERVKEGESCPDKESLVDRIESRCQSLETNRIRPVLNATGVVLHTNLGRAPYAGNTIDDVSSVNRGYANLEMNLEDGGRGGRGRYAEMLLTQLTGAGAAAIVNNCSAALVLAMTALARDRNVVISRGELVQIGGGFRIPEILEVSGTSLAEVGTTNRTSLDDYRGEIDDDTGAILRVHRSNFDMVGFTGVPDLAELTELASDHELPLVCDLGSGALIDTESLGLRHERRPSEVLEGGADLVMFSGDKLLGGPQAGILLGNDSMVQKLKDHPLFRAMRCDKTTLTALESTLTAYATDGSDDLPVHRMLGASVESLKSRAEAIRERLPRGDEVSVAEMDGTVGGGAMPTESIPSAGLRVQTDDPDRLLEDLRSVAPPVVARIKDDAVQLNLRSVLPEQDESLGDALESVLGDES
jgi:L-seryl-tRNA(Ser) seleniumtransferase